MASFAWSYPLNQRLLALSVCSQSHELNLGLIEIDRAGKGEAAAVFRDRYNRMQYMVEVVEDEGSGMKIVRIVYLQNAKDQKELLSKQQLENARRHEEVSKITLKMKEFGLSIVSS